MLEVRALVAGYGRSTALEGVDLTLGAGEIVTLLGANGAGKSTLLKSISGLLPARSGEILFEGARIDQLSARARVRLGIVHVPEGRQIFVGLSVLDNLRLGAFTVRRTLGEAGLAARLEAVCERFPVLRERLYDPVGHLSGGQQQMLALARGLMAGPRLLLLDEPSLGLGPRLVAQMFKLVAQLRDGGISILLSEQNARMSLAIANRGYVIESGRIALAGEGRDLIGRAEVAERYLGVGGTAAVLDRERHRAWLERLGAIFPARAREAD
ncbi:MAG TPA: ABC transporter ATP-binding protein [Alphaproteobacteria bacterium]|nr:ABC transporter ATP-binding protein [Alphaproteobacteria bacterium]